MELDALKYLVELGNPPLVEIDGRPYSALKLNEIGDPMVTPLTVHTLTGLVDYFNTIEAYKVAGKLFIHIFSPGKVALYGELQDKWKQRDCYINVDLDLGTPFRFGQWYDHEQFVIELQSKFLQTMETEQILKVVGKITDGAVKTIMDDGVTQGVHTKSGIRKSEEFVPNPVTLQPFRTFIEVEQPKGKFILRLKSGKDGDLPIVALFDADGGQWRLDAIKSIKEWLTDQLPEITIIA